MTLSGSSLKKKVAPLLCVTLGRNGLDPPVAPQVPSCCVPAPCPPMLPLAMWKLSHPMGQGWLDIPLPEPPCSRVSWCSIAPLQVRAPHPHRALQGLWETAMLLLSLFPGNRWTLMVFTGDGDRSVEDAGSEAAPHLWSCSLLCWWTGWYLNWGKEDGAAWERAGLLLKEPTEQKMECYVGWEQ